MGESHTSKKATEAVGDGAEENTDPAETETREIDPAAGSVDDSRPEYVVERTGLEPLEAEEIYRHRYDGQYGGEPASHFLGGSDDITFNDGHEISTRYDRVKDHIKASNKQKHWRDAYHQIGFIASRLNLPAPVRDDISRAYAKLRKKGKVKAGRRTLEQVLGHLTYIACRVHDYPRGFDDVENAIDELYDVRLSRNNLTADMVKAFNKGTLRFGINEVGSKKYLRSWKRADGEKTDRRSLGRI